MATKTPEQKAAAAAAQAAAQATQGKKGEKVGAVTLLEPSSQRAPKPSSKTFGVLGNQHVIEMGKKMVNGTEYNEVTLGNGCMMLLSDRDLEKQLIKE